MRLSCYKQGMQRTFCFLALWATTSCALACDGKATYTSTNSAGVKTGLFLSEDHFLGAPIWNPGSGEPPLTVGRAVNIALDWAKRTLPKYDGVKFSDLQLISYQCRRSEPRWYYRIDYLPMFDGNEVYGARGWLAVLMDGSVIEPRVIEE